MEYALLLKRYWREAAALVVAVFLCVYVLSLRTQLALKDAALAEQKTAQVELQATHDRLNDSIKALGVQSKATQARVNAIAASLSKQQTALTSKLDKILTAPVPETCADSIEFLRQGAR